MLNRHVTQFCEMKWDVRHVTQFCEMKWDVK